MLRCVLELRAPGLRDPYSPHRASSSTDCLAPDADAALRVNESDASWWRSPELPITMEQNVRTQPCKRGSCIQRHPLLPLYNRCFVQGNFLDASFNTGVMFLRSNAAVLEAMRAWVDAIVTEGSSLNGAHAWDDQQARPSDPAVVGLGDESRSLTHSSVLPSSIAGFRRADAGWEREQKTIHAVSNSPPGPRGSGPRAMGDEWTAAAGHPACEAVRQRQHLFPAARASEAGRGAASPGAQHLPGAAGSRLPARPQSSRSPDAAGRGRSSSGRRGSEPDSGLQGCGSLPAPSPGSSLPSASGTSPGTQSRRPACAVCCSRGWLPWGCGRAPAATARSA